MPIDAKIGQLLGTEQVPSGGGFEAAVPSDVSAARCAANNSRCAAATFPPLNVDSAIAAHLRRYRTRSDPFIAGSRPIVCSRSAKAWRDRRLRLNCANGSSAARKASTRGGTTRGACSAPPRQKSAATKTLMRGDEEANEGKGWVTAEEAAVDSATSAPSEL